MLRVDAMRDDDEYAFRRGAQARYTAGYVLSVPRAASARIAMPV